MSFWKNHFLFLSYLILFNACSSKILDETNPPFSNQTFINDYQSIKLIDKKSTVDSTLFSSLMFEPGIDNTRKFMRILENKNYTWKIHSTEPNLNERILTREKPLFKNAKSFYFKAKRNELDTSKVIIGPHKGSRKSKFYHPKRLLAHKNLGRRNGCSLIVNLNDTIESFRFIKFFSHPDTKKTYFKLYNDGSKAKLYLENISEVEISENEPQILFDFKNSKGLGSHKSILYHSVSTIEIMTTLGASITATTILGSGVPTMFYIFGTAAFLGVSGGCIAGGMKHPIQKYNGYKLPKIEN